LEEQRLAVPATRFTYAIGRLVLYAPSWGAVGDGERGLRTRDIRHLAIANPHTAPYGAAALEVLHAWRLQDEYEARIVRGENVGQAFQFIESGASEAGFVALSQVVNKDSASYWIVPDRLHDSIRQDAVLLRHGETNDHARQYLAFLRSEEGRRVIEGYGYSLPESER
jgi:molybdate transport system substrate-binding protein